MQQKNRGRLFVLGKRKERRDGTHTHAHVQKQSNHKLRVISLRGGGGHGVVVVKGDSCTGGQFTL